MLGQVLTYPTYFVLIPTGFSPKTWPSRFVPSQNGLLSTVFKATFKYREIAKKLKININYGL